MNAIGRYRLIGTNNTLDHAYYSNSELDTCRTWRGGVDASDSDFLDYI